MKRRGLFSLSRSYFAWLALAAGTVLLATVLRTYCLQSFGISTRSMMPTLLVGDYVIANKLFYKLGLESPERGDVVVFHQAASGEREESKLKTNHYYIKRIVGIPGDSIWIRAGDVFVNGEKIVDRGRNLSELGMERPLRDTSKRVLKKSEYYVLGDNQRNSVDSRSFGVVRREAIEGEAVFVYWSWNVEAEKREARFERIGRRVGEA